MFTNFFQGVTTSHDENVKSICGVIQCHAFREQFVTYAWQMARHGANHLCRLDVLRATKMPRIGTPHCAAFREQNCQREACFSFPQNFVSGILYPPSWSPHSSAQSTSQKILDFACLLASSSANLLIYEIATGKRGALAVIGRCAVCTTASVKWERLDVVKPSGHWPATPRTTKVAFPNHKSMNH